MNRALLAAGTAVALCAGGASAQSHYASVFVTPSSINASATFATDGPLSFEVGAFSTFRGDVGLFGAVNLIQTVPVAQTFPVSVTPFYGATLSTVVNVPLRASLGGSAYLGATFPITQDTAWYVLSGPSFQLLPDQNITFGGVTQVGFNYYFD